MARPKSKNELLSASTENFNKLIKFVLALPDKNIVFPKGYLNRNPRDVLAHLHEWHNMMQSWYIEGMDGKRPEMPKKGFTWKTTSDLNEKIWAMYQDESFNDVEEKLRRSHNDVMQLIEMHSNEDLFTKKKYKWTGSTSLGAYLISSTSSHYDWAYKLIKKCAK